MTEAVLAMAMLGVVLLIFGAAGLCKVTSDIRAHRKDQEAKHGS